MESKITRLDTKKKIVMHKQQHEIKKIIKRYATIIKHKIARIHGNRKLIIGGFEFWSCKTIVKLQDAC